LKKAVILQIFEGKSAEDLSKRLIIKRTLYSSVIKTGSGIKKSFDPQLMFIQTDLVSDFGEVNLFDSYY
jgi:hypothetical protein